MVGDATVWLRQSDHFPLRFEVKGMESMIRGEYKNVEMNPQLPDSLFKVPTGYTVEKFHLSDAEELNEAYILKHKGK